MKKNIALKKCPQLLGARTTKEWRPHGSDRPTSPRTILLHSYKWSTQTLIPAVYILWQIIVLLIPLLYLYILAWVTCWHFSSCSSWQTGVSSSTSCSWYLKISNLKWLKDSPVKDYKIKLAKCLQDLLFLNLSVISNYRPSI